MKITYAILKEYCAVALEPKKLADLLTRHGVKVESLEGQGDNTVFEFEITANRPDCLSFIGIARETALITKAKAKPGQKSKIPAAKSKIAPFIRIKEPKLCPMYTGRIIRDVKVGPSPAWLKNHLESLGLRSINNVVDITNWVLLETGQPLHAFDLDKLAGQEIIVRTAAKGENLVAIDAKTYVLTPDMLVIADAQKPVALAGIMGGKDTEVTESTKNILLESAYFNPTCIRRTSRHLALPTDSSYRFERIVDPKGVVTASQRAAGFILEMAGGTLTGYQVLDYLKYKDRKVVLRTERISRILGIAIPAPEIKRILIGLGLMIKKSSAKGFELVAPSFRPDINIEVDIIEELARIYGYDKIPVTPPCIELKVAQPDRIYDVTRTARSHLVETGYNEVMTNSFWDKEALFIDTLDGKFQAVDLVGLLAPDGTTDRFLRNNLVKGLLEVFNLNENYLHSQAQKTIKFFEISKTYHKVGNATKEGFSLGIVDNAGFYSLKGTLEGLSSVLGLQDKISFTAQNTAVVPKGIQNIVGINLDNTPIGYLGTMQKAPSDVYRSGRDHAPIGAAHREADVTIGVLEVDFEALISQADLAKQYKSFIRLPAVTRDIAVVVSEDTTWAQIESISRQALTPSAQDIPLEKIEFFDIYRGKQVQSGHKSIAFSLTFRHPTRTLASEAVDGVVKTVVDALAKDLKATLRA
ncbi:MAG: phenylalanine--tRNA ligase subunit beta [Planctomycetes bacterium]|nr:phenylalanine--tRNA ligase subunit beta [Planctomycetota bacterium]